MLNASVKFLQLHGRPLSLMHSGLLPMTAAVKRIWVDGDELPKKLPERCRATFLAPSWMKKATYLPLSLTPVSVFCTCVSNHGIVYSTLTQGWSKDSAGFVWWFTPRCIHSPGACHFGERLVSTLLTGPHKDAEAVQVHAIAHRYPVDSETLRDLQTWHVAATSLNKHPLSPSRRL